MKADEKESYNFLFFFVPSSLPVPPASYICALSSIYLVLCVHLSLRRCLPGDIGTHPLLRHRRLIVASPVPPHCRFALSTQHAVVSHVSPHSVISLAPPQHAVASPVPPQATMTSPGPLQQTWALHVPLQHTVASPSRPQATRLPLHSPSSITVIPRTIYSHYNNLHYTTHTQYTERVITCRSILQSSISCSAIFILCFPFGSYILSGVSAAIFLKIPTPLEHDFRPLPTSLS